MSDKKLKILFISSNCWNQFTPLHNYLQETQIADSLFLASELETNWYRERNTTIPQNIVTYIPDGSLNEHSYYYIGLIESSARNGAEIVKICKEVIKAHQIDLVYAHATTGHPHILFDELSVPIVAYLEFPSFRKHQWDPQYPPADMQRYYDKYFEMMNYYTLMKCDLAITPSLYAKNMVPDYLQHKVVNQMEGFNPADIAFNNPDLMPFKKEDGFIYAGYLASGLTSEKGFEHFIITSQRLAAINPNIRFVIIGSPSGTSYGFDKNHVGEYASFKDYLFNKYQVNEGIYISTGSLNMQALSTVIHHMDFFLYPLQFGSATWGFYEIFLRGKIMIASNRCFIPETITDGINGFLVDYEDTEKWVSLSNTIANNLANYQHIGANAAIFGTQYYMDNVARKHLDIFNKVVANYQINRSF